MTDTDSEGDLIAYQRFCLIADKIEADPDLLRIPLENIERWIAGGHWAKRELTQWREWIEQAKATESGRASLLGLLRDDSEEARDWKGFSPFPGILTKAERRRLAWTSRH